jgi:acyl-CoA oxidase
LVKRKFWDLHLSPVMAYDGAATTLLTIQYNLVIGTLAPYAAKQPYLASLMYDLLKFRTLGQFLCTEVGHGLDVASMQTTATQLSSGEFLLSSPSDKAAK